MNVWNASLEDFHIENLAECRSDAWGNAVAWKEELYKLGEEYNEVIPLWLTQDIVFSINSSHTCNYSNSASPVSQKRRNIFSSTPSGIMSSTRAGATTRVARSPPQRQLRSTRSSWTSRTVWLFQISMRNVSRLGAASSSGWDTTTWSWKVRLLSVAH